MDSRALKGRDKIFAETVTGRRIRVAGGRLSRPFRACRGRWLFTQAVGLGWHVPAFQASHAINPATATCEMPILPRNPRQGRRVNQSLGNAPGTGENVEPALKARFKPTISHNPPNTKSITDTRSSRTNTVDCSPNTTSNTMRGMSGMESRLRFQTAWLNRASALIHSVNRNPGSMPQTCFDHAPLARIPCPILYIQKRPAPHSLWTAAALLLGREVAGKCKIRLP